MHLISIWKNNVEGIFNTSINSFINAKGFTGFFFTSSFGRLLFFALVIIIGLLAVIGLITVLTWIVKIRRKKK